MTSTFEEVCEDDSDNWKLTAAARWSLGSGPTASNGMNALLDRVKMPESHPLLKSAPGSYTPQAGSGSGKLVNVD